MLQSCPALCDPIDGSPPGSAANPGILLARVQEWVAIVFSLNLATVSKFYTIVLLQLNNLSNFLSKKTFNIVFVKSLKTFGCYCCCQVASVVSDSVRPHGLQPTRLLDAHGILQARTLEWGAISFSKTFGSEERTAGTGNPPSRLHFPLNLSPSKLSLF